MSKIKKKMNSDKCPEPQTKVKHMPMMTDTPSTISEHRIRDLELELLLARQTIVQFMPKPTFEVLTDYRSCSSLGDFLEWQDRVVASITSMAEVDPESSHFESRGCCPLCKGGTSHPYESGFKIPEGVEKHLMGKGNASQCVVTEAAFKNARYMLRNKFEASERAARQQLEVRRGREQTFLIDPSLPPKLLDEDQCWNKPRSPEALEMAEQRLRNLNFEKEDSANVVAYKMWYEGRLVLADPRIAGRITFRIFGGEKLRKESKQASFNLPDGWKNNLRDKFLDLLIVTCSTLPRKR